jgi:hypothetical protein
MKTKQTALQWFVERLPYSIETQFSKQIQEAMQMERKQIEHAHRWGQEDEKDFWNIGDKIGTRFTIKSEEYYNKTYGGQDE